MVWNNLAVTVNCELPTMLSKVSTRSMRLWFDMKVLPDYADEVENLIRLEIGLLVFNNWIDLESVSLFVTIG